MKYEWRVEIFADNGNIVAAWCRNDIELPYRPVKGDVIPPASLGPAFYRHFGSQEVTECQICPALSDGCSLGHHYLPGAKHDQDYAGMMVVVRVSSRSATKTRLEIIKTDMEAEDWVTCGWWPENTPAE